MVTLGVLDGDGIGPEVVPQAVRVLEACTEATGDSLDFVELPVGWDAYDEYGSSLPETTFEGLEGCDGWLMGPVFVGEYPDVGGDATTEGFTDAVIERLRAVADRDADA